MGSLRFADRQSGQVIALDGLDASLSIPDFSGPFTLTGTVGTDVVGGATSPIALVCGTPQTVTVQTAQNTISGDGRSLTLTLGTPTGGNAALVPGQSASTVAVLDDDGPKIVPTMGMLGLGLMSLMLAGLVGFQRRRLGK